MRKSLNLYALWNFDGPKLPESAFSPTTLRYSDLHFFNFTCFILFHQSVTLDIFIAEVDCLLLSFLKYDLYIGIES